jgi:peptidoglycan L-alanyl-D-glutamate endopeptidase CwlK
MPQFGKASLEKLNTCDPRLIKVFLEVVKHYDCMIIEGHRNQAAQHAAFVAGNSQLDWPNGNHNKMPSRAVDAGPYPLEFPQEKDDARTKQKKIMQFCYFAGFVVATGKSMGIDIRWGGDWDQDYDLKDNKFDDLVHFEVK